jgi:aspartate carbamoyltransferase catalytic subunit
MGRNLLGIRYIDDATIRTLLTTADEFKKRIRNGKSVPSLSKHVVGMLFFENSTRTRISFEQAAFT